MDYDVKHFHLLAGVFDFAVTGSAFPNAVAAVSNNSLQRESSSCATVSVTHSPARTPPVSQCVCDQLLIRSGHSPLSVTPSDRKLLVRGGGEILVSVCQLAQQVANDTETQTVSEHNTNTNKHQSDQSDSGTPLLGASKEIKACI